MGLREKAEKAQNLKIEYSRLYDNENFKEAKTKELEYLTLRREVLEEIDATNKRQRSEEIATVKARVAKREKPKRRETGVRELDMELVTPAMHYREERGGFSLGNFIQLAGSRGSGKSSLMLKILTDLSKYEKVCWFDFEMGEARVVKKLESFAYDDKNLLYYGSSRTLSDVTDEIKFLNASGVNHFVIDSAMKIEVPNVDNYNRFSHISSKLSALTSSLSVNIYLINQMSQESEKTGVLAIKHGNDAEYDADFIFYMLRMRKRDDNGKLMSDEYGMPMFEEDKRLLKCTKNRQDEREFELVLPKSALLGVVPIEITYEEN